VGAWTSLTGVTPERQERSYSATAYYKPVCERPNLKVLTRAIAEEIVLEKDGGEWVVKGVTFTHDGQEHTVKTEGEVIVCGGSVSSPQLLELSGIGNPEILKAAGIECKINNPNVGENLQEHMSKPPFISFLHLIPPNTLLVTAMVFEIDPSTTTSEDLRSDPVLAASADKEYALHQAGPRTAIPSSVAYLPFTHFVPSDDLKALARSLNSGTEPQSLRDKILLSRLLTDQNLGQIEYNFDTSNYNPYYPSQPGKKYATMLMMLQYPFSKGSIHISAVPPLPSAAAAGATNPKPTAETKPVINPQYYEGKGGALDFALMTLSQTFANLICKTPPLASIISRRVFPPAPETNGGGSEQPPLPATASERTTKPHTHPTQPEDFAPWIRATTITDWHPVGTCAMGGHGGIRDGVVDARLRVYGARGLRVCDASVMPLQIAAHLQATVYAIGEKGGEMVGEDWAGRGGKGRRGCEVCGVRE